MWSLLRMQMFSMSRYTLLQWLYVIHSTEYLFLNVSFCGHPCFWVCWLGSFRRDTAALRLQDSLAQTILESIHKDDKSYEHAALKILKNWMHEWPIFLQTLMWFIQTQKSMRLLLTCVCRCSGGARSFSFEGLCFPLWFSELFDRINRQE